MTTTTDPQLRQVELWLRYGGLAALLMAFAMAWATPEGETSQLPAFLFFCAIGCAVGLVIISQKEHRAAKARARERGDHSTSAAAKPRYWLGIVGGFALLLGAAGTISAAGPHQTTTVEMILGPILLGVGLLCIIALVVAAVRHRSADSIGDRATSSADDD